MLALVAAVLVAIPTLDIKVSIIQGPVEAKAGAGGDFAPLKAGGQLPIPCVVRTGDAGKAWLDLPGAFELRMNEQTEVEIQADRKMALKRGRVYLKVPKAATDFEMLTEFHPIRTEHCVFDMEYKPHVPNGAPASTLYMVLEGALQAHSKKFSPVVSQGWWATAYGSQLNTPDTLRNGSMDTSWVHPLLVERGIDDQETTMRTEELLSVLTRQPENDPAEVALRSLGELAAPGLIRYLGRPVLLETQVARRAVAARLLSDAATTKSAAQLVGLLTHGEPQVRLLIVKALERIAGGKDLGFKDDYWKGDKLEDGQKAWEEWVRQNVK